MTDSNVEMTPVISDVKHYKVEKDADGNEVRVEIKAEDVIKKLPA